jgi:ABC-type dipeptide/oligopeptide/nickel transport system permease component
MRLYEYILRRLGLLVVVLFVVSLITFYLARGPLGPGTALGPYITQKMSDAEKLQIAISVGVATPSCPSFQAFSFNDPKCLVPLWQQYVSWLSLVLKGNWGYSLLPGVSGGTTSSWSVFASRFPYTAELALAASLLTVVLAIPLGVLSATHSNRLPDHFSRLLSILGYSMPIFWLGFLLQLVFGVYLTIPEGAFHVAILPTNGAFSTTCAICVGNPGTVTSYTGAPFFDGILSLNGAYAWDGFVPLILPTITLSISSFAAITRVTRSSMLEALRQDYIILARSKGLRERVVIYRHALRNALLAPLTVAGLALAYLFGGVVITEYIFSWPGVGSAFLAAVTVFDLNFLQLYIIVIALIIVLANLAVDIIYAVLDPRIKY